MKLFALIPYYNELKNKSYSTAEVLIDAEVESVNINSLGEVSVDEMSILNSSDYQKSKEEARKILTKIMTDVQ